MRSDDFVDWYQALEVGPTTVSLNKYMIGADFSSPKAAARGAVRSAASLNGLCPDPNSFLRANCGKVSPSDCEHILSLALQTGLIKQDDLQDWADKNLGVDCTGFAIAYYDDTGLIDIDKYSGGASCFTLLNGAKHNHRDSDGGPLIWSLEDVEADDMILWMNTAQVETRAPGHISIIYEVDQDRGILHCGESNGANDGAGHFGPQSKERQWVGEVESNGQHYVQLNKSDRVIIVRPPPSFG